MTQLPAHLQYTKLSDRAHQCRACDKMSFGRTFLNEHNGPVPSEIMIIGEATNVGTDDMIAKPMWDSPSGWNLNKLLDSVGISREEVFVTNTVLHTPVRYDGGMRYVTPQEQGACSHFLREQINIVNPLIICTLGNRALEGLAQSVEHHLSLRHDVGRAFPVDKTRWLIPLYHPSPQVMSSWRTWNQQYIDYQSIPRTLARARSLVNV